MTAAPHPPRTRPAPARPITRLVLVVLLAGPLLLALLARSRDPAFATIPMPTATDDGARTTEPRTSFGLPQPVLGVALNCHHIGNLPLYLQSVDAIVDLGGNTLILVTPWYQEDVNATKIRHRRTTCPQPEQLVAILERAEQHGLSTILMPLVLLEEPGEKDWRGTIAPDDWDAWWSSYFAFIEHFAGLAGRTGVDLFSIGSELNTTEHDLDRWREVIRRVREQGYDGPLLYSSNWDRYPRAEIWPLVDVMGVSSYFELERDRPGAPVTSLEQAWAPIQQQLLSTARTHDRPLLLTEVGYPSLPWANAHPWNYVAPAGQKADHEAQARSWRAFFRAWSDVVVDPSTNVAGFCVYRWDPYHHGDERDTGYGIVGKPAWRTVETGFEVIREAAAARSAARR